MSPLNNKKVVVTGGAGFVGSAIVRELIHHDARVTALVRPNGDRARLRAVTTAIAECDIEDSSAVERVLAEVSPDIVIHTAVAAGHPADVSGEQLAWRVNATATEGLLQAMTHLTASRLVHIGSSLEYGPSAEPLSETSVCEPVTVRGASKLAATTAVRTWCREFARQGIVLRPFSVYGPRQQTERLIPTLMRCALTGEPFSMVDGTSRRDFVWLGDMVTACIRACGAVSTDCPIVNVGSGVEHSVTEVCDAVETVTSRRIRVIDGARPRQPQDVEHWVADTTRCRDVLGWTPETTLLEGLTTLVQCR